MFPDREPILELQGEVVTGRKGCGPMRRSDCDGHRYLANAKLSGAVVGGDALNLGKFLQSFFDQLLAFGLGEDGMRGVIEGSDLLPLMVVPHSSFEDDQGTGGGGFRLRDEGSGVNRLVGDLEHKFER